MREISPIHRHETGAPVNLVPPAILLSHMRELNNLIARRAYEIFESRGKEHGRHLDDWLQAESEVMYTCRHDLRESDLAFTLRAEVPGSFTAEQLKVSVEPHRLMVGGERELDVLRGDSSGTHSEKRSQYIFGVHDLPDEVDPAKAKAILRGEVLEIVMPKVTVAAKSEKKVKVASRANWSAGDSSLRGPYTAKFDAVPSRYRATEERRVKPMV
jgi:HSP20 family protein